MINSWKSSNFLNYFTHEGKQLMRFKKSKTNDNALTLAYGAHICIMLYLFSFIHHSYPIAIIHSKAEPLRSSFFCSRCLHYEWYLNNYKRHTHCQVWSGLLLNTATFLLWQTCIFIIITFSVLCYRIISLIIMYTPLHMLSSFSYLAPPSIVHNRRPLSQ